MENLLICLTRGLVAAAITCCVVPILFRLDVASIRLRKGFGPLDAEFFTYLGYAAAKLIVMYGMLIAFISSAITVLWILSFTRPWVIRAWRRPCASSTPSSSSAPSRKKHGWTKPILNTTGSDQRAACGGDHRSPFFHAAAAWPQLISLT